MANTAVLINPAGEIVKFYRKIHLYGFDHGEAILLNRGTEIVTVPQTPIGHVGLAICYDLRFPELFRAEADQGADIIVVPAAFTEATGRDHWELLLRARAVENQTMVIAAAQWGTSPDGTERHGHALIVDAWGRVLADAGPEGDTFVEAEFDATAQSDIRNRLPALTHRRLNR
jgi:nitrilase